MKEVIKILDYACKPHLLYLVIFEGNDELFCKIGITGNDVESRFKDESNYEILKYTTIKFKNGKEARGVESILLEQILSMGDKYKPLKQFGGYSECYNANIYGKISKIFKVIPTHKLNLEVEPVKHKTKIEYKYFNLGSKFECNLISAILSDHTFGSGILDVMDINYFDDELFRKIAITIKSDYEKYETVPDMNRLKVCLIDSSKDDLQKDLILRELRHIEDIEGNDKYFVQSRALRFCKEQDYSRTIKKVREHLSLGDDKTLEKSESLIEELFLWDIRFNKSNIGKTFIESKKTKVSNSQRNVNTILDVAKARQKEMEKLNDVEDVFDDINEILRLPTQRIDGNIEQWVLDGKYHREDGPAVIKRNETGTKKEKVKEWYLNGKRHRVDGPAIVKDIGPKEWYLNGKRHRVDGPAIVKGNGTKEWYLNGKRHRVDGPAIEVYTGSKEWWIHGANKKKITSKGKIICDKF